MVIVKKNDRKVKDKQWENPLNPEKTGDDRDREQLERQLKEAKRRKNNLTANNNDKQTKN